MMVARYLTRGVKLTPRFHFCLRQFGVSSVSCQKIAKFEKSYVCGPGNVHLLGLTVGQLLQRAADKFGDNEAVVAVHQNLRKTYQELLKDADQLAAGFVGLGLQRGDRVGIWGPNSYEWLLTQWAAARAGLILVNINPAYRPAELKYALNKVGVKCLVASESFKNVSYYGILDEILPELSASKDCGYINSKAVPSLESLVMISDKDHRGTFSFKNIFESAGPEASAQVQRRQDVIQFDDPANIQFTSGTTGSPKGATLSHFNIVNNGYLTGFRSGYHKKTHRLCIPVPLYHCFGSVVGVLSATSHGAASVLSSPVFSAHEAIKAVAQERCTSLYGTPTMYVDMLNVKDLDQYDVTSLHTGYMSGAPCPQELVKQVFQKLNMKDMVVVYGMTETSPVTFACYSHDPMELRHSTIGYPSDHTEVKVVDDNNRVVPVNVAGHLCTRGYTTMLGYWNDEAKTKETITADRWLLTGDIAIIAGNGYGKIVGRAKDMLIRGGENIYPREIEELLHTHPSVIEAHVIGVPDARLGEQVCAWVRLQPGTGADEEQLVDFCRKQLAYFKVPKYWMFRHDFPKTVTGKIQKFKMRQISISELNLANTDQSSSAHQ